MIGRSKPLACQELVEVVNDYMEGAMSRRERRRFDTHVGACPGCSTYLEQIRQTVVLTGRITPETIDPAARDALLHAFRDWKQARVA